jgi:putative membrane protein
MNENFIQLLPKINVSLNFISTIFLLSGYILIKNGKKYWHRRMMESALFSSSLFLIFYLIYHYHVGSKPYLYNDWTRTLYFSILIPHILLAALMVPFIISTFYLAYRAKWTTHKKIARFTFPIWLYVSISGVIIYIMLYII